MNENQRKHIANSLRVIGMAQFASYGYFAVQSSEWGLALMSGFAYVILELIAILVLRSQRDDRL